jgi:ubiquinone/menaquinone biosynthesis C-methylase UbiE
VFSPYGLSARELAVQALSSVEGGYDLLASKFDHTPFRTPDDLLDAPAEALRPLGPFGPGLDVCCGTGAGMRTLRSLCQGRVTSVDFSTGMLAQARRAYPDAEWVRADVRTLPFTGLSTWRLDSGRSGTSCPPVRPTLFASVYRAVQPGGVIAVPIRAPQLITSGGYWALLGFDLAMRIRNAVWRPPFVMYYRTYPLPSLREEVTASGFTVTTVPPDDPGPPRGRQPAIPADPCAKIQHPD